MKALCWFGKQDVRVETVPEPRILNQSDAIIRVTSTAICGSDLHLYDGFIPTMEQGDILGHEFMGEVVDVGSEVTRLRTGDRVVVPFPIACGRCSYCRTEQHSLCDNSNPNAWMAEKAYGYSPAGIFGYSHMMGGYAGGQAEFVRVPFADVGPLKLENGVADETVLFLTDILPTAYMAVENCHLKRGQIVAIWGCGPIGQLAIDCAFLLGASRVIAIDRFEKRLQMAKSAGAEVIDYRDAEVSEVLREMTGGRGPDACIDAVGMEAHGFGAGALYDKAAQKVRFVSDRATVLRQAIYACRKGGTVSLAGVYGGFVDKVPMGAAFNKGLTLKMGQTHVQRYMKMLFEHVIEGRLKPSRIITHRLSLEEAPKAYDTFLNKQDDCVKVVLKP
jgi:threonine dehydrogenase-like Zn-dependent dehydrogenase